MGPGLRPCARPAPYRNDVLDEQNDVPQHFGITIEDRRFYVFTHDGSAQRIGQRNAAVLDGQAPAGLSAT